jgi:hypothetical protein
MNAKLWRVRIGSPARNKSVLVEAATEEEAREKGLAKLRLQVDPEIFEARCEFGIEVYAA